MRRMTLLLAAIALTLAACTGTAWAKGATRGVKGCWGTAGGDLMIGTPSDDLICGLGSDDLILGLGGDDRLTGDAGDDLVRGGLEVDRVKGNVGDDLVVGGGGVDLVVGGRGGDLVVGGPGSDVVVGGSGEDSLRGGSGEDFIQARDGIGDRISCGAGNLDQVSFDKGLDRVAADCESKHPTLDTNNRGGVTVENVGTLCCRIFPRWCR